MSDLSRQRILKQVSDPEAFSTDSTSLRWRQKNCFIYESTFSPRSAAAARALMKEDIERFFQLQVDTIGKDTTCFVIRLGDTSKIIHGKKGVHGDTNILDHLNTPVFFRNESLSAIAAMLEQQYGIPVINETGFKGRLVLDLPADFHDFDAVSADFRKQGFSILRTKRKINFLLIKDQISFNHQTIHN
jgi:hypothetical protein